MNSQTQDYNAVSLLSKNGNNSPQIMSFSLIAILGKTSSGKTYLQNQLREEYQRQCVKDKYDFKTPLNIDDSKFTHNILISPTALYDQTLEKKQDLIMINSDKAEQVFSFIIKLGEEYILYKNAMEYIFNYIDREMHIIQQLGSYSNIHKYIGIDANIKLVLIYVQNLIKFMNMYNVKYKECMRPYRDDRLTLLFQFFGLKYAGLCQRPKIMLSLDDVSGESWISNINVVNNSFYQLIKIRRHLGVYACLINIHSFSLLNSQLRQLITAYIIKRGIKDAHMQILYEELSTLHSVGYQLKDFVEQYQECTGFNVKHTDDLKENDRLMDKYKYSFIYIIVQPVNQIYYNFDKRIK